MQDASAEGAQDGNQAECNFFWKRRDDTLDLEQYYASLAAQEQQTPSDVAGNEQGSDEEDEQFEMVDPGTQQPLEILNLPNNEAEDEEDDEEEFVEA